MTILAIGEITIANIDDVNISTDQPIDPVPDQLWLDTGTVPNILKRWAWIEDEEGWGWINASPTSPEDIGAETPDGAQEKAQAARDAARNNLAYQLGYANYSDMVTKARNANKTIIDGGYLNTELLEANSIVASKIAANAVTAGKIDAGSITSTHIDVAGLDAGVIKTGKLASNVVQIGPETTYEVEEVYTWQKYAGMTWQEVNNEVM